MSKWRVGRSYGIHVYEVGDTSPEFDRPVATFFTEPDATQAVADHNGEDGDEQALRNKIAAEIETEGWRMHVEQRRHGFFAAARIARNGVPDSALGRCQALLQCHRETGHAGGHEAREENTDG